LSFANIPKQDVLAKVYSGYKRVAAHAKNDTTRSHRETIKGRWTTNDDQRNCGRVEQKQMVSEKGQITY
jgi:hypothetical protein